MRPHLEVMTEHAFVKRVHRHLPSELYRWKVADRYTNGVPDAWYSGPAGDLWVEYKYLPRTPRRVFTPALSALQKKWLIERHREGRNVAVVVGCPDGALPITAENIEQRIKPTHWLSIKELVTWITAHCLPKPP